MRFRSLAIVLCCCFIPVASPSQAADEALLAKVRALYDAPFARSLVSFDCAVDFDWKKHFAEVLGGVPLSAASIVEPLQAIQHRIFVDRLGATISAIPKAPDLSRIEHGAELEQVFGTVVSGGLNAWLPFSRNLILPVLPINFSFQKIATGYKVSMNGTDVSATLLLKDDMRLLSGVSRLPQPLSFATDFSGGPNGYLLTSLKTGAANDTVLNGAAFAYTYQPVQDFQLPSLVTVTQPHEVWHYSLNDCKVSERMTVKVHRLSR